MHRRHDFGDGDKPDHRSHQTYTATRGNTVNASGTNVVLTPIPPADFNRMRQEVGTATLATQQVTAPTGTAPAAVAAQVAAPFISPAK